MQEIDEEDSGKLVEVGRTCSVNQSRRDAERWRHSDAEDVGQEVR